MNQDKKSVTFYLDPRNKFGHVSRTARGQVSWVYGGYRIRIRFRTSSIIVVTSRIDRFKKRFLLVPGSKSKLNFFKQEFNIIILGGMALLIIFRLNQKYTPLFFLKLNKILRYFNIENCTDRGTSSKFIEFMNLN